MILVTGATGELGKLVIDNLLTHIPANEISAFVRDSNKATNLIQKGIALKVGDYNETATLENAMRDIDKLVLISSNDIFNRLSQHKNAIDAAKKSGVKHIIYISGFLNNTETSSLKMPMAALLQTEDYLKESGLPYTILQNTLYMENIAKYIGANFIETGICFSAGEGKVAFATRADLAEAIANVALSEEHINKTYKLTGVEGYSFFDIADQLSLLSGKTIPYLNPEPATYLDVLKKLGVPDQMAQVSLMFGTAIKNNDVNVVDTALEKLIGRKPTNLGTFLKNCFLVAN